VEVLHGFGRTKELQAMVIRKPAKRFVYQQNEWVVEQIGIYGSGSRLRKPSLFSGRSKEQE